MKIKDSGERTEFESGAVRDMKQGKGRCDLMPLGVVATSMKDYVLACISAFKDTGNEKNLYAALYTFSNEHYKESMANMYLEVAKHFEEGALKYGENNWQKGIPESSYIDSAVRHYLKVLRGDNDEPHDRAFVWNIICLIWTHANNESNK